MSKRAIELGQTLYTAHKVFMLGADISPEDFDEYSAVNLVHRIDELANLAHECAGPSATSNQLLDEFMSIAPPILAEESEIKNDTDALHYGMAMCLAYVEFINQYGY